VAADEGDHETAHALHAESLKGFLELGDRHNIAASLEAFAALAASVQERAARAARLFGAAQSLREALSVPLPPDERHEHEHAVSVARTALDEEAFAHTWAEGRAMTLEQAAVYALEGNEA
jgi:hypothetical protein